MCSKRIKSHFIKKKFYYLENLIFEFKFPKFQCDAFFNVKKFYFRIIKTFYHCYNLFVVQLSLIKIR